MDGLGIREELRDMARRIGTVGYYVMLPNLFYRDGGPSFDPAHLATRGPDPEMDRLNRALSHSMVLSDTRALIDFAAADPAAREPVGTVGYCMGRAATPTPRRGRFRTGSPRWSRCTQASR